MRRFGLLGAASGFVAVALGAFGAHGLRDRLSAELLHTFDTAARYQMYHALGLVLLALLPRTRAAATAGWLFAAGTLLFSGSLYALCLTGATAFGAITPLGGLCFLGGWASLALHFVGRDGERASRDRPADTR